MTGDVAPGAQKAKAADLHARAAAEAVKALDHLHSLVEEGVRFEVSDDGRLDLHGMTAAQAQAAIGEFLRTMRARSERCVLIIHGKGERHAGAAVLRGEIAAWLSQGKARDQVAAFATARDEDGGEGAVYVALRR